MYTTEARSDSDRRQRGFIWYETIPIRRVVAHNIRMYYVVISIIPILKDYQLRLTVIINVRSLVLLEVGNIFRFLIVVFSNIIIIFNSADGCAGWRRHALCSISFSPRHSRKEPASTMTVAP